MVLFADIEAAQSPICVDVAPCYNAALAKAFGPGLESGGSCYLER